jgi:hypothetical protein
MGPLDNKGTHWSIGNWDGLTTWNDEGHSLDCEENRIPGLDIIALISPEAILPPDGEPGQHLAFDSSRGLYWAPPLKREDDDY